MCGRFTLDTTKISLKEIGVSQVRYNPPARFNIAPTTGIAVVRQEPNEGRELVELRWGLIPDWAKPDSKLPLMINARAETVASKPSYRSAFKTRRCIVPASGYYEWKKLPDGTKQPYYFTRTNGGLLAFGAIWEGETVATITTVPNKEASAVHDRMPVILGADQFERWFSPEPLSEDERQNFLGPLPDGSLNSYPVDRRVGSVRHDDPGLIDPTSD